MRALLALACIVAASAAKALEIAPEDFDETVLEHSNVLVQFHAPWCGVCRMIKPEVERVPELLEQHGINAVVARVDVKSSMEWAKEKDVGSVPTFKLYKDGQPFDFPMLTTAEAYAAGMAKMLGQELDISPAKEFRGDALAMSQWLFWRGTSNGKIVTTLALYRPAVLQGAALAKAEQATAAFDTVAKELLRFSDLRFAFTSDNDILYEFEMQMDRPTLVLYTDHDEGRNEYSGPLEAEALKAWLFQRNTPLVVDVWHKNLQQLRRRVSNFGLYFISGKDFENPGMLASVTRQLNSVVGALVAQGVVKRGDFTLAIADGDKYSSWMKQFKLPTGHFPAMSMEDTKAGTGFSTAALVEKSKKKKEAVKVAADGSQAQDEVEEDAKVPTAAVEAFLRKYASGTASPVVTGLKG